MKKIKISLTPRDYHTFHEAFGLDGPPLKTAINEILEEYAIMLRTFIEDYPDYKTKEYRVNLHLSVTEMKPPSA